uniref:Apple domain-containing protein n=1 Tax=Parascaris univalens TaxID=6257 RepID=A0A914ZG74_PARUN
MQCSGFNQREGPSDYAHHCQLYQADQLQHVDGFVEADDRYSFYWKYCVHCSFGFEYECKDDGILVKVDSKYPYTGALYGLYDFFTCRIEPKEAKRIEYFFPSPTVSKNCSDSIRYKV